MYVHVCRSTNNLQTHAVNKYIKAVVPFLFSVVLVLGVTNLRKSLLMSSCWPVHLSTKRDGYEKANEVSSF